MLAVGKASLVDLLHPVHGEGGDLPVGQRDVDPVPGVQVLEVVEHRDAGERIHVAEDDRRAALAGRRAVPVPAGQVVVVERRHLHRAVRVLADLHHRRVDVDARDADADRNRAGQRLSLRVVGQPRRDGRHRCRGVGRPGIGGRASNSPNAATPTPPAHSTAAARAVPRAHRPSGLRRWRGQVQRRLGEPSCASGGRRTDQGRPTPARPRRRPRPADRYRRRRCCRRRRCWRRPTGRPTDWR